MMVVIEDSDKLQNGPESGHSVYLVFMYCKKTFLWYFCHLHGLYQKGAFWYKRCRPKGMLVLHLPQVIADRPRPGEREEQVGAQRRTQVAASRAEVLARNRLLVTA